MKPVLPALVAAVCALTACRTTADRFDLYQPSRAAGPATERSRGMTLAGRDDHGSTTFTYPGTEAAATPNPAESGPIAPPPPPPPDTGLPVGAPSATPLPGGLPQAPAQAPLPAAAPGAAPAPAPATQEPAIPGLNNTPPAGGAPAGAESPAPAIPGLSQ